MSKSGELYPGQQLDDMLARKWQENRTNNIGKDVGTREEILEKSRDTAKLARYVAYRGSFISQWENVIEFNRELRKELSNDNYEYIGTWYVPLDFNRFVSAREMPRGNNDEEIKVGLNLMVGEKEPEVKTIAAFSETSVIEFGLEGTLDMEDLCTIEGLLKHIHNSNEK
jgi:hypothetical protein